MTIHTKNIHRILLFVSILSFPACRKKIDYNQQYDTAAKYFLPAWNLCLEGDPKNALILCDSLLYNAKQPTLMMRFVRYEYKMSILDKKDNRQKLKATDIVIQYIDSAIALIEDNDLETKIADRYSLMLLNKAEVLYQLHQPDKANKLFFFAEKFSEKYNDEFTKYLVANKIAFITYRQKKFQQALLFFKKSFYFHRLYTPNDYYKDAETSDNIALCFSKMNQFDSAIYYYDNALNLLDKNKDSSRSFISGIGDSKNASDRSRGVILGNLGNLYFKRGQIDSAILLSNQSIALNSKVCCEQRDAQLVKMRLIDMYSQKKDWNKMYRLLVSQREGLDSLPNAESELSYLRQMAAYYDAIKEPAKAYPLMLSYIAMKDSINTIEQKDEEINFVKDLKLKEQEADLIVLKKDNENEKLYLVITIVLILIALNIIVFGVVNYRKTRRTNSVLTQLYKQIYEQKTALEKANIEKDRIMNIVAHDLRNPISGIGALAKNILNDDLKEEKFQKLISLIEKASIHSLSLINELLEKHETENEKLNKQNTEINELIKQSVELLVFNAKEKDQVIEIKLLNNKCNVLIDERKIERVVNNLVTNAIKFSPSHSKIIVELQQQVKNIVIIVKDEGIGIPESQKEHLFDMFSVVKRIGTAGEKSFGLGLFICKQIVEEHGGKIWAENDVEKGSVFYVTLPV